MALYVYGIVRARDAAQVIKDAPENEALPLEAVEHDDVAALVSPLPDGELRIRRDNVLAHSNVLQTAFEYGPVLPLRLGTALPDQAALVRELLAPRGDVLSSRLSDFDGKAEMQVKSIYAEEPLLRSILDQSPALRKAVERTRGLPAAATHFDQIRIGEAISEAVEARRMADGDALLDPLRRLALALSVAPPHHERAVLNAAFLIDRKRLEEFDSTVENLSRERSPEMEFKLIGPIPPYSFVERGPASTAAGR